MSPSLQVDGALSSAAARAGERAAQRLLSLQDAQGYWSFEVLAGAPLEAEYILLELWLHPPESGVWSPPHPARIRHAAAAILARQLPNGGFGLYPGGPADASATVMAYFALKMAGIPATDARIERARERVLALGGIESANNLVKINLSLFGLYPREHCPPLAPEMILLPGKFIYRAPAWMRAMIVPLAIIQSFSPARPVPAGFTLQELFARQGGAKGRGDLVRLLKWYERHPLGWLRRRAVARCQRWMLERMRGGDGLGAILPSILYSILALDLLGYPPDHPDRTEAQAQFERLIRDEDGRFRIQPCIPMVWDTAVAAFAVGEWGGAAAEAALARCAEWLQAKEVRRKGDWSVWRPRTAPSGWFFESANEFYPDNDSTAMVLLALSHLRAQPACIGRALEWLLAMQSPDGGWAAFDVDRSRKFFADRDATCPDLTGRVLEAVATALGVGAGHPAVRRAVGYLLGNQEADGSWRGRWGVNYIHGTFLALRGLRAAGVDNHEAPVLRAGEWLRSIQNPDGGWGESCASYTQGSFSPAPSTASQTGWALLGLMAGGDWESLSVRQGTEYLVRAQREDGGWDEEMATGTWMPGVYHLNYHLYRLAYPLQALAEYRKAAQGGDA